MKVIFPSENSRIDIKSMICINNYYATSEYEKENLPLERSECAIHRVKKDTLLTSCIQHFFGARKFG
jgi:hypothetical protein